MSKTALQHVLMGLIPYTRENIDLTFKPHHFFNELERIDQQKSSVSHKKESLRIAYYRAKQKGLIQIGPDGWPCLTEEGKDKLARFSPKKLKGAKLVVIFDIKEIYRSSRDEFRRLLIELRFTQVQRSVWISNYDSRQILAVEISRMSLGKDVIAYEAREIDL